MNLSWLKHLYPIQFTHHCVLCHARQKSSHPVCVNCYNELPRLGKTCLSCTSPLLHHQQLRCFACMRKQPAIDCILSSFAFETTLRHVLHRYKYHEGLYLTAFLATLMLEALPTHYTTQCLIPIPMHRAQLKRRGYNQAQLLAQYLGRAIHRPVNTSHCEKIRDTANQAGLSARMRQGNLRHAFLVKKIPYRHVTLVDDLITTGSTTNELARTLKRTGVERVDVWCCAKTVLTEFDA